MIDVRADADGERVVFEVRDHGIGIPRVDLERIFERFYRVDQARSRDTGGTGLGLAIVRHVVHAHGGDVTVSSLEGQGSTFQIALPLVAATEGARHDETRVRLMAEAPLILVVDDEQSYRDALRVALEREGFRVEAAADGAEATRAIRRQPSPARAPRRDVAAHLGGGRVPRAAVPFAGADHHGDGAQRRDRRGRRARGGCGRLRDQAVPAPRARRTGQGGPPSRPRVTTQARSTRVTCSRSVTCASTPDVTRCGSTGRRWRCR